MVPRLIMLYIIFLMHGNRSLFKSLQKHEVHLAYYKNVLQFIISSVSIFFFKCMQILKKTSIKSIVETWATLMPAN